MLGKCVRNKIPFTWRKQNVPSCIFKAKYNYCKQTAYSEYSKIIWRNTSRCPPKVIIPLFSLFFIIYFVAFFCIIMIFNRGIFSRFFFRIFLYGCINVVNSFLNSLTPCPRPFIISGSFLPPKSSRAMAPMSRSSVVPINKIMMSLLY